MEWLFQALVLILTAAFWWLAQRDLTARAAEARAPAAEDWERLRVTVEQLMVELERRAVVAEQRIIEAEQRLQATQQRIPAASAPPRPSSVPPVLSLTAATTPVPETPISDDGRYAAIDVLLQEGISDAAEIERRTGLGRGEITLYLSLRGRRML